MKITDIRLRKLTRESKVKGIASITFDDCFVVHDIKIIEGKDGLFVAMPSRTTNDGEYRDIAHPINSDTRSYIKDEIIKKFNEFDEE